MTGSSVAGVVTAVASGITALGLFVTAVGVLIPTLRRTKRVEKQVIEVHTIVNQQRTDMQNYNIALVAALRKAGVEVPYDQSAGVDSGQSP